MIIAFCAQLFPQILEKKKKRHTTRAPYKSQMEPNLQKERKAIYHFSAEFDFSNFSLELAMTDFNPRQG